MLLLFLSLDNECVLVRGEIPKGLFASSLLFGGKFSTISRLGLSILARRVRMLI